MWCVDLPGTQSILKPKPGINQECITSKLLVITFIKKLEGKIKILFVFNNLALLKSEILLKFL